MWQSSRLIEIDIGVLKYGRMQLKDLPKFDGVILCYDSLVPASYEALPNLMGGSSRRLRHRPTFHVYMCNQPSAYGKEVPPIPSPSRCCFKSLFLYDPLPVGFHRLATPFIVVGCRDDFPRHVSPEAVADESSQFGAGLVLTTTTTEQGVKRMQGAFSWVVKAVLRRRESSKEQE
jgi:hypothetical protein